MTENLQADVRQKRQLLIVRCCPNIKTFLDAKSLDVNIFTSKETAFQIRSYGWSAQSPCAFVSNLEQLVIYDTRFIPSPDQKADIGTKQFSIDDYIENFDIIFKHLWHDNICSNKLEQLYKLKATEGNNQLDSNFMLMLSDFRLKLAKRLAELNPKIIKNDSLLNYYVQVILDRIIFIRVCESKEIEQHEKLKNFFLMNMASGTHLKTAVTWSFIIIMMEQCSDEMKRFRI